jgi:hypothetical protein
VNLNKNLKKKKLNIPRPPIEFKKKKHLQLMFRMINLSKKQYSWLRYKVFRIQLRKILLW